MSTVGSLRKQVMQKFASARANQDLTFSDTCLAIIHIANIPFQLRYCPALSKKPTKKPTSEGQSKKSFDPFDNPTAALLVASISARGQTHDRLITANTLCETSPTHNLILNKYPVIENHFILATKDDKPQTDLLEAEDLALTLACLKAWQADDASGSLFAFFNSGKESGASQAHRHLQFLPIEDMQDASKGDWSVLCDRIIQLEHSNSTTRGHARLPFACFAAPIAPDITSTALHQTYQRLLKAAYAITRGDSVSADVSLNWLQDELHISFSYNMAMTCDTIAVLPRRSESSSLREIPDSLVSVNGTILGGTLMVKSEVEFEAVQRNPTLLEQILKDITFPATDFSREDLVSKY